MDQLLSTSVFADKFRETFGVLGSNIPWFGNLFACFLLLNCFIDEAVIVFHQFEFRKSSGATFDFVRTKLRSTFRPILFSFQTPMYDSDEKTSGNLPLHNAKGNE